MCPPSFMQVSNPWSSPESIYPSLTNTSTPSSSSLPLSLLEDLSSNKNSVIKMQIIFWPMTDMNRSSPCFLCCPYLLCRPAANQHSIVSPCSCIWKTPRIIVLGFVKSFHMLVLTTCVVPAMSCRICNWHFHSETVEFPLDAKQPAGAEIVSKHLQIVCMTWYPLKVSQSCIISDARRFYDLRPRFSFLKQIWLLDVIPKSFDFVAFLPVDNQNWVEIAGCKNQSILFYSATNASVFMFLKPYISCPQQLR